MENDYQFRPIVEKDDASVCRLIKTVLEEFGANKPGTAYFDESTNHLSTIFDTSRSAYWVIEYDGEVIGAGGIFPTAGLAEDTCELVKLYIDPAHRGKGLGKMLINSCFEEAKAQGYRYIYLESMPELADAVALYKKMGFENRSSPLGNSCHFGCSIWMEKLLV